MMERVAFSVAVFVRCDDAVLLIAHKRLQTWLPPGGEIEAGETPQQAAARELREETGIDVTFDATHAVAMPDLINVDGTPAGLVAYEEHSAGSKGRHLNFCFVADVPPPIKVTLNDESTDHRFVRLDDIAGLDAPKNVKQIAAHLLTTPLTTVARRWLQHFNNKDLDALLALYADTAVHTSPKLREREPSTGGRISGKAALRAWWHDAFVRLPSLRYTERHVTTSNDRVFLEYVRSVDGQDDLVVAELFVVRHNRIVESHVFHG
jgi:8-oxo-dGTP diphosphatase